MVQDNAPFRKNDIIPLSITDVTAEGDGVGRYGGMAVFVPSSAAGDVMDCRILKVTKSLAYGKTEKLITPSGDRENRGCEVKNLCGGCTFRHISYNAELRIKENAVKNAFIRIGGFTEDETEFLPAIGCTETDRYRNKAQYPVARGKDGRIISGFYAGRSHRVIPCGDCLLQPRVFSDILSEVINCAEKYNISPYDEKTGKGLLRHVCIRRGYHSGEIMVCLVVTAKDRRLAETADRLAEKFPDIKSVIMNINPCSTNVIMGRKCVTLYGSDTIEDIMCGNRIKLSPLSFYQVNTAQAERLYKEAARMAGLTGSERLLDLYCGAGTVGLSMAGKAKSVTGAEIVPEAVDNARENARINGIENADFICADAGEAARMLAEKGERPDVIVTDPPRKGCSGETLESIVKMSPGRIVMISCNPATAARDCRFLADRGYRLAYVRAVDMFAGTGHTECVALLSEKTSYE